MIVSLFSGGASDTRPLPLHTTWKEWVETCQKNGHISVSNVAPDPDSEKAAKLACPCFVPAEFRPHGKRIDGDVVAVTFAVVDFDHAEMKAIADCLIKLEGLGQEYLLYSSWSHSPSNLSLRCMMPLDRSVSGSEWTSFWPKLNAYVDGLADRSCKNAARAYFLPATSSARIGSSFMRHNPGKPLGVDSLGPLTGEEIQASRVLYPVERKEVTALARKLDKSNPPIGNALAKVLRGEPWAEPGFRDRMLYDLAREIGQAFPKGDPYTIATVFEQSCSHYAGEFSVDSVAYKIRRRQEEVVKREEEKLEAAAGARKIAIRTAFGGNRDAPYTEIELDALAEELGIDRPTLAKRWILQRGGTVYVLCNGDYLGPWPMVVSKLASHTFLSPATSAGVRLEEIGITGQFVRRSIDDLAMDYGTPVLNAVVDMTAQRTRYEAETSTIVEASCPLRDLEPCYNEHVDVWLRLLAGAQYRILEEWLSWVTELRYPCAALFIEGPPGCGKSLLGKGIARIWSVETPTTLSQCFAAFNEYLARCPLVVADETMPTDSRGKPKTGDLREFIQAETRPIKRKNIPDASLRGAARVIISANNHTLLEGEEHLSTWDIDAIVARIIHIKVNDGAHSAKALLETYGNKGITNGWVNQDEIARHVLHLVETVKRPTNPPRFLVAQNAGVLHRSLSTSTPIASGVAHWLVSFLLDPARLRMGGLPGSSSHLVQVRDATLYVGPRALVEHWGKYETNIPSERATARAISQGIRGMSDTSHEHRVSLQVNGFTHRPKFFRIRTGDLIEWGESSGIATAEDILGALAKIGEGAIDTARKAN